MTENKSKPMRIPLSAKANSDLQQMMSEAKGKESSIDLTPSQLASWVLSRYFKTAFHRDRNLIRNEHFNPRKHLKEALSSASNDEEFNDILRSTINRVNEINRKKEKSKEGQSNLSSNDGDER